jgi:two-component sensor histidine kinase
VLSDLPIDYELLFKLSPNPYVVLDSELTIVWMNDAYLRATMRDREAIQGLPMFEAFPSEPGTNSRALLQTSLARVLDTGEVDEIALIRYAISAPDGGMEERFWSATHTPLLDGDGRVAFVLQHTVDVTELQNLRQMRDEIGVVQRAGAVQARNTDLLSQSQRFRSLFEQAPGFMALLGGASHEFQLANAAYRRLVGGREVVGKSVCEALPEVVDQGFIHILDTVRQGGKPYFGRGEKVVLGGDDDDERKERYLDFIYQPIFAEDASVSGVFVQGHDVTEELALLERQNLLINELNHRVKNTLAIVQGLAAQSFRAVDPTGASRVTFDARLKALAAAHDLLTERTWEPISLGDTIRMAVVASAGEDAARVAISGPEVQLAPQHAVALAMAVHELTTNACKYGALSWPAGDVSVHWARAGEDDPLVIDWIEEGGPPVVAPQRKGFGTRLIERGLSAEVEGSAKIDFRPEGLRCRFTFKLPAHPA